MRSPTVAVFPSQLQVNSTSPAPTAVTIPSDVIVATSGALEVHTTTRSSRTLFSESTTVAPSTTRPPTTMPVGAVVGRTIATDAGPIRISTLPRTPSASANANAKPGDNARKTPASEIVPIFG
jgi:hypothetical protein